MGKVHNPGGENFWRSFQVVQSGLREKTVVSDHSHPLHLDKSLCGSINHECMGGSSTQSVAGEAQKGGAPDLT